MMTVFYIVVGGDEALRYYMLAAKQGEPIAKKKLESRRK